MGIIYKIENINNSKVYIGQTIQPLKYRVANHIYSSSKECKPGTLHYDIKMHGIENFSIEILEECENSKLSEREVYWIDFYDSFRNGYNRNSGGATYMHTLNRDKIIEMAKAKKTLTEIAAAVGAVSLSPIKHTLEAAGVEYVRGNSRGPIKVVMYSKDWKMLKLWDSISQAYNGLEGVSISESSFQHKVRLACGSLDTVAGYHWVMLEDLIVYLKGHMYICRTPFDKDNLDSGLAYEIQDNIVITKIDPKALEKAAKCRFCGIEVETGENICQDCLLSHPRCYENRVNSRARDKSIESKHRYRHVENAYSNRLLNMPSSEVLAEEMKYMSYEAMDRKYNMCKEVLTDALKELGIYERRIKDTAPGELPSKEILEKEIKGQSYENVAAKYNVSTTTLRDKLKEYGIYERRCNDVSYEDLAKLILDGRTIKEVAEITGASKWKVRQAAESYGIPCWVYNNNTPVYRIGGIEGRKLYFSLVEAAEDLGGLNMADRAKGSMAWNIGNAIRNNKKYNGYTWELADKADLIDKVKAKIFSSGASV